VLPLDAARDGNIEVVNTLVSRPSALDVLVVDECTGFLYHTRSHGVLVLTLQTPIIDRLFTMRCAILGIVLA